MSENQTSILTKLILFTKCCIKCRKHGKHNTVVPLGKTQHSAKLKNNKSTYNVDLCMLPVASDIFFYSLVLFICCQFKFITFQNHLGLSHFMEKSTRTKRIIGVPLHMLLLNLQWLDHLDDKAITCNAQKSKNHHYESFNWQNSWSGLVVSFFPPFFSSWMAIMSNLIWNQQFPINSHYMHKLLGKVTRHLRI